MEPTSRPKLRLIQPEDLPAGAGGGYMTEMPAENLAGLESWLLGMGAEEQGSQPAIGDLGDGAGLVAGGGLGGTGALDAPLPVSARFEAVLQGAAQGLHCDAAALYTLDAATTELRMRSMWGLSPSRLIEDPRPLRGAVADLEAMCGSAVVLEDDTCNPQWRVPEPCAASVCVPVATASTVLGTVWFFCDAPREFDDGTTGLMEIVAGRLAAELELEELREAHRAGLWSWTSLADGDAPAT